LKISSKMKSQKHTKNLYKKADNLCLNNPFSFFISSKNSAKR
jgi:hypothetical protein